MKFDSSSPGGKIYCPNQDCGRWLGEYCFLGVQCDCGEISSPGIALLRRVPGTQAVRTEFRRVQEAGDDIDSVSSSRGEDDFDDDEIEEESYAEGEGGGDDDDDAEEDDDDDEEDEEREEDEENAYDRDHGLAPEAEQENVTYLATSTIPISPPNDRLARQFSNAPTTAQTQLIQRQLSNTSRPPSQPPNSTIFRSPRPPNPNNLPATPSRLRIALIPRSTPSSTTSSENGDSDDEGGMQTIGEPEEPVIDWNEYLAQNPAAHQGN